MLPRAFIGMIVVAACIAACGDPDDSPDRRVAATATAPTTAATSTAASGATVTKPPDPGCGDTGQTRAPRDDDVSLDADGDGVTDRFNAYLRSDGSGHDLTLMLGHGGSSTAHIEGAPTAAPIGGFDVDRDGRDELFVTTGNGAYTTWIDVFTFNPSTCSLTRLSEDTRVPQFAAGASVGAGAGLACVDGLLVSTEFARTNDEPLMYSGERTRFEIDGSQLRVVGREHFSATANEAGTTATFSCGELRLP